MYRYLWWYPIILRVPWTARRSNQSIIKEISPKYSLEGLMLKLKLQYFGHLMRRINSLEKTLMLGKIEGRRRRGRQRTRWLDGIIYSMDMFGQAPVVGDGQGSLASCSPRGYKELDMTEWLNWIITNIIHCRPWLHICGASFSPQYYWLNMYREHIKHQAQCWARDIVVNKNRHSPVLMEVMG